MKDEKTSKEGKEISDAIPKIAKSRPVAKAPFVADKKGRAVPASEAKKTEKQQIAEIKTQLFDQGVDFDDDASIEDLRGLLPLGAADQEEEDEEHVKAVYRELLPGKKTIKSRKGPIAYKTFGSRKDAEEFVRKTGGKIVS